MSVSMPIQRFRGERSTHLKEHLLAAANRLSTELGYNTADASPRVLRDAGSTAQATL